MISRIILLSSSFEDETRSVVNDPNAHYPLGLAYIHSYLEIMGHNVITLFLNNYEYEHCLNTLNKNITSMNPNIIGIQIFSNNRVSSFRIIEYLHEHHPNISIIIGGIHASLMHEQIINKYPYLVAVLGEGELTFSELAEKIGSSNKIDSINGIAYYNDAGIIIRTRPRELIKDLDILPFPKHEDFFDNKRNVASILTSRGCPFSCSFCCLDTVSKRKVRYRSVNNVIQEILFLKSRFSQLSTIWIHDDSFFLDNERAISICEEIASRKIKLNFICSGRVKPVSEKLVKAMEMAGFRQVLVGLESGSEKILKNSHKSITPDDAINAYRLFKNSPIELTSFLIVGLWGEDDNTIFETIKLVQTLQKIKYTYFDDIGVLYIYPGTEIYEIAKSAGFINDDYWMSDKPVPFFTVEHSFEKLLEYKNIIRNSISLKKIITYHGFKAQKRMFPQIIIYCINHPSIVYRFIKKCVRTVIYRLPIHGGNGQAA